MVRMARLGPPWISDQNPFIPKAGHAFPHMGAAGASAP